MVQLVQATSWVRFPMESLEFFSDLILPVALYQEPFLGVKMAGA
jgi:hypothetical protein